MTMFLLWLLWTLVVFGGGLWCGWRWSHPVVEYVQVEIMRRRLRIVQKAWDAERALWHDTDRRSREGRR